MLYGVVVVSLVRVCVLLLFVLMCALCANACVMLYVLLCAIRVCKCVCLLNVSVRIVCDLFVMLCGLCW